MQKTLFFLKLILRQIGHVWASISGIFLKSIRFLFLPELIDLEQGRGAKNKALDEISSQWNKLWSCVDEKWNPNYQYQTRPEQLSVGMSRRVGVEWCSVKRVFLSHASDDSTSSKMLRCYRNAGEPVADDISFTSSILSSVFNFANKIQPSQQISTARHFVCSAFFMFIFYLYLFKYLKWLSVVSSLQINWDKLQLSIGTQYLLEQYLPQQGWSLLYLCKR